MIEPATSRRGGQDPTRGSPFVNLGLWTLLLALLGIGLGFRDPAVGWWVYAGVGGAVGFAFGCFTQWSDHPIAEALRLPRGFMVLVQMVSGPTK